MADIASDVVEKGIRTITFVPLSIDLPTTDRGTIGLDIELVAFYNGINTNFLFCAYYSYNNGSLSFSGNKRFLLFDYQKNICVFDSCTYSGRSFFIHPGYTRCVSKSYSINPPQIENLNSVCNYCKIRIETDTSFVESVSSIGIGEYFKDGITKAIKAIGNTSSTFLNI